MIYGSVCSGIEAATRAWHALGWTPAFFSEIEPFPSAVLAHHYGSNMPGEAFTGNGIRNYGDFTKIGADAGPIDLLVGGTPCQSFSVAGKRLGLDDPRGNLALEYLALAIRLRARWIVWENVPGVLSSVSDEEDGEGGIQPGLDGRAAGDEWIEESDFATFLSFVRECGYGFAYRVLDAQYVRVDGFARAVPQRRRRVFVVGYLGDWRPAAAVLFEPQGMRGDPAPRREARKGVAPTIASRPSGGGGLGTDFDLDGGLIARGRCAKQRVTATIISKDGRRFVGENDCENPQQSCPRAGMPTGEGYHLCQIVCRQTGHAEVNALRAAGSEASGGTLYLEGHSYVCDDCKVACDAAGIVRITIGSPPHVAAFGGGNRGGSIDVSTALTAHGQRQDFEVETFIAEIAATLPAGGNSTGGERQPGMGAETAATMLVAHALRGEGFDASEDGTGRGAPIVPVVARTLTRGAESSGKGGYAGRRQEDDDNIVAFDLTQATSPVNRSVPSDISPSLTKDGRVHAATSWAVRRLTPTECERLQGFDDGFTNVPWRGSETAPDGPRYKALGNSMAVNVMRWIGVRIDIMEGLIRSGKVAE